MSVLFFTKKCLKIIIMGNNIQQRKGGAPMLYVVVFFVLTVGFLFSRVRIYLEYVRHGEDDLIEINLSYLKLLKYSFDVSLIDIAKHHDEFGFKFISDIVRKKRKKSDEGFIDLKTIINKLKKIKRFYNYYKNSIDDILTTFNNGTNYEKINIKIEEGTGEPAYTGIVGGIVYSLVYSIFGFVSNKIRIINHSIKIIPNFNKPIFKINIDCIFTIRIGNIICVGIRLILLLLLHRNYSSKNNSNSLNTNIN